MMKSENTLLLWQKRPSPRPGTLATCKFKEETKVVPSGFCTKFCPGHDISNGLPTQLVRATISSCSRRLMCMTKAPLERIFENLTSQLTVCRTELRSLCDDRLYTDLSLSILKLNAQLYDFFAYDQRKKIQI